MPKTGEKTIAPQQLFPPNSLHFDIPLQHKNKGFFCNAIKAAWEEWYLCITSFSRVKKPLCHNDFSAKSVTFPVLPIPSLNPVSQASHSKNVICRICNPKICSVCICAIDKQIFECYTWSKTERAKVSCSSQQKLREGARVLIKQHELKGQLNWQHDELTPPNSRAQKHSTCSGLKKRQEMCRPFAPGFCFPSLH